MTHICECGKEFNNKKSLISHYTHCDIHCQCNGKKLKRKPHVGSMNWENRTPEEIQLSHLKSGQTLKNKIKSGEFTPYWKGKHHSEKTKQLLRENHKEVKLTDAQIKKSIEKSRKTRMEKYGS